MSRNTQSAYKINNINAIVNKPYVPPENNGDFVLKCCVLFQVSWVKIQIYKEMIVTAQLNLNSSCEWQSKQLGTPSPHQSLKRLRHLQATYEGDFQFYPKEEKCIVPPPPQKRDFLTHWGSSIFVSKTNWWKNIPQYLTSFNQP